MHTLFCDYFAGKLRAAETELNSVAVAALMKPELTSVAQIQLGRCKALSDILFELNNGAKKP